MKFAEYTNEAANTKDLEKQIKSIFARYQKEVLQYIMRDDKKAIRYLISWVRDTLGDMRAEVDELLKQIE
jgi:hypothetical protein